MSNSNKHFFDNPKNTQLVLRIFYSICILLFLLDFFIHRHISHEWEWLWGFYPLFGFVGCVVLVLIAKWMRTVLMRGEEYYEPMDTNTKEKGKKSHVGK